MSGKDLKAFAKFLKGKSASSSSQLPRAPGNAGERQKFKHGYTAIITSGPYKGDVGEVREYLPATVVVDTRDNTYVRYERFSPPQLDVVKTLPDTRLGRVVELDYHQVSHPAVHNKPFVHANELFRLVRYKGEYARLMREGNSDCVIKPIKDDDFVPSLALDVMEHFANKLVNEKISYHQEQTVSCKLLGSYPKAILLSDQKGMKRGLIVSISQDEPYARVVVPHQARILASSIQDGVIKKGPLRGMKANIVEKHEAQVRLLMPNSDKITLPVSMIFYRDLLLTNDRPFQVDKIVKDGNTEKIFGKQFGERKEIKKITKSDIKMLFPGFSFKDNVDEDAPAVASTQPEFISEMNNQVESASNEEYTESFEDRQRTQRMQEQLNKDEEKLYDMIEKISQIFNLKGRLNPYALIVEIQNAIQKLVGELQRQQINDFIDEGTLRFIVAGMVLRDIVKNGLTAVFGKGNTIIRAYTLSLTKNKFLKDHYTQSNLMGSGTTLFDVYLPIPQPPTSLEQLMNNTWKLLNTMANTDLQPRTGPHFPLIEGDSLYVLGKTQRKGDIIKMVTPRDVLENRVPATAKRIYWGPRFQPLLEEYNNSLRNRIRDAPNDNTREVYEYVLKNLERAPIVLNESTNEGKDKLAREKTKMLKFISEYLFKEAAKIYARERKEKDERFAEYTDAIKRDQPKGSKKKPISSGFLYEEKERNQLKHAYVDYLINQSKIGALTESELSEMTNLVDQMTDVENQLKWLERDDFFKPKLMDYRGNDDAQTNDMYASSETKALRKKLDDLRRQYEQRLGQINKTLNEVRKMPSIQHKADYDEPYWKAKNDIVDANMARASISKPLLPGKRKTVEKINLKPDEPQKKVKVEQVNTNEMSQRLRDMSLDEPGIDTSELVQRVGNMSVKPNLDTLFDDFEEIEKTNGKDSSELDALFDHYEELERQESRSNTNVTGTDITTDIDANTSDSDETVKLLKRHGLLSNDDDDDKDSM